MDILTALTVIGVLGGFMFWIFSKLDGDIKSLDTKLDQNIKAMDAKIEASHRRMDQLYGVIIEMLKQR